MQGTGSRIIRAVKTILSIPSQESHSSAHAAFLRADAERLRRIRGGIAERSETPVAARFRARIRGSRISGGFDGKRDASARVAPPTPGLL